MNYHYCHWKKLIFSFRTYKKPAHFNTNEPLEYRNHMELSSLWSLDDVIENRQGWRHNNILFTLLHFMMHMLMFNSNLLVLHLSTFFEMVFNYHIVKSRLWLCDEFWQICQEALCYIIHVSHSSCRCLYSCIRDQEMSCMQTCISTICVCSCLHIHANQ